MTVDWCTKVAVDKFVFPQGLFTATLSQLFFGKGWNGSDTALDRRRRMVQGQSPVIDADSRAAILAVHLPQRFQKHPPKFVHPLVAPAELILERFPRNKLRFAEFDAVKALCQPCVNIQRHSRMR